MRTEKILHSPRPFLENYKVILETKNPVNYGINGLAYNFYVGDNTKRILSSHSLPKFIQLKLAMINSIPKEDWNLEQYENYLLEVDCYAHRKNFTKNPEFKNIGWCMSDSIYVIVMSEDELSELKGISIDTRKESQRESQTHTQRT